MCRSHQRERKRRGLDPQFDPRRLGIENATFWGLRADRKLQVGAGGEPPEKQLDRD